jgi:hypothetical protein
MSGCRTIGQRHTYSHKHLLKTSGSNRDQHLGGPIRFVLERVWCTDRHIGEHTCQRHDLIAVNRERDLSFKNVKGFFFSTMDMRRRSTARRNDSFPHGVFAIGFIAGRQKTVHVTDNGDGAALVGFANKGQVGHSRGSFIAKAFI